MYRRRSRSMYTARPGRTNTYPMGRMRSVSRSRSRSRRPARKRTVTRRRYTKRTLRSRVVRTKSKLSRCAREYALSLANPRTGPVNAGVPHGFARPSSRVRVWSKGKLRGFSKNFFSPEKPNARLTLTSLHTLPTPLSPISQT